MNDLIPVDSAAPGQSPRRGFEVTETEGDTTSIVELRVAKEDLGRIKGKQRPYRSSQSERSSALGIAGESQDRS